MWRSCRSIAVRRLEAERLPRRSCVNGACTVNGRPLRSTARALTGSSREWRPHEQISAAGAISAMRSSAAASGNLA